MTMEKPGGGAAQQTPEEVKKPQEGFQEPPAEPEGEAGKAASGQDAAQEGLGVACPPAEPEGEAGGAASGQDAAAGQPPQQAEAAPEEETDARGRGGGGGRPVHHPGAVHPAVPHQPGGLQGVPPADERRRL